MSKGNLRFPKGFLWGAATSSHQIEGNNRNDWTAWEAEPGHIKDHSRSGAAAEHWQRYPRDYQLLTDLHLGAYRLSIEWSRIEPRAGQYDHDALDHYAHMIASLRRRHIEPMVTLHHFTNPQWATELGGWANPEVVGRFVAYALVVVEALGAQVQYWCTINEPSVLAGLGYLVGTFPPGHHSLIAFLRARRHLVQAHRRLYRDIRHTYRHRGWRTPQIGLAYHLSYVEPRHPGSPFDWLAARIYDWINNGYYLEHTVRWADFIGLNYYFARRISFRLGGPLLGLMAETPVAGAPASDLGWQLVPDGLYRLCLRLSRYDKPILVTENGLADAGDQHRPWSIVHHVRALHQAIAAGAPVRGYFHWTLIDSFEWENGLTPRYGLYAIDYDTQRRHPRPSAHIYADIARTNSLSDELLERFS